MRISGETRESPEIYSVFAIDDPKLLLSYFVIFVKDKDILVLLQNLSIYFRDPAILLLSMRFV